MGWKMKKIMSLGGSSGADILSAVGKCPGIRGAG